MSLLCVCAQLTLQTGHQPLVRVVRHQTSQLQPPLDLWAHKKKKKKKKDKLQRYQMRTSKTGLPWKRSAN